MAALYSGDIQHLVHQICHLVHLRVEGVQNRYLAFAYPARRRVVFGQPSTAAYGVPCHVSVKVVDQCWGQGVHMGGGSEHDVDGTPAQRPRKAGVVVVTDPDALAKQANSERAYQDAERSGIVLWTQDEAGPFSTVPYAGQVWQPQAHPTQQSHEYIRTGTAKVLTLFHPVTGEVRVKGVTSATNLVLHEWLKTTYTQRKHNRRVP